MVYTANTMFIGQAYAGLHALYINNIFINVFEGFYFIKQT